MNEEVARDGRETPGPQDARVARDKGAERDEVRELQELVRRAQAGDAGAFAQVVERCREVVLGTARALLGNFHDAEEVTQDVFLAAWRELPSLRDPARLEGWLYRITRNRCSTYRERRRAWRQDLLPLEGAEWPAYAEPDRAARAEADAVQEALASLSEANRLATSLFYLDGYTVAEVAGVLGVPPGTVRRRLHDSRALLKARLPRAAGASRRRKESAMPAMPAVPALMVPRDALRTALDRVVLAADATGTRPLLKSVCFSPRPGGLTLTAADGFRLAIASVTGTDGQAGEPEIFIVPLEDVLRLRERLEASRARNASIDYDSARRSFSVTFGGATHTATGMEGSYPDVGKIVPQTWQTRAITSAEVLLDAVRAAASGGRPPVLFDPVPDCLRLYSADGSEAFCEAEVEGDVGAGGEGAAQRVALSAPLLIPILEAAGSGRLELCWTGPTQPVRLSTLDGPACTWALQPMHAPSVMQHQFAE